MKCRNCDSIQFDKIDPKKHPLICLTWGHNVLICSNCGEIHTQVDDDFPKELRIKESKK